MRTFLQAVLPVAAVALSALPASAAEAPFAISVSLASEVLKAGEPIRLKITLTNLAGHALTLAEAAGPRAEFDYAIEVLDPAGQLARETAYGRSVNGHGGGLLSTNLKTVSVAPGASLEGEAVASRLYDMTRAGRYQIRVWRQIPEESGDGYVRSDVVSVTVTQ